MLPKEHIEKFKALWLEHYNEEISDEYAYEQAYKLISLVKIVYQDKLPRTVLEKFN